MRTNLILHLHCSECGTRLRLCYKNEAQKPPKESGYMEADKEPTGAECFYPGSISVEPCRKCIEKYTGPARRLVDALDGLRSV